MMALHFPTSKLKYLVVTCVFCCFLISGTVPAFATSISHLTPHNPHIPLDYYPTAILHNHTCDFKNDVWNINLRDPHNYPYNWTPSSDAEICTSAQWYLNGTYSYYYFYLWVPSDHATADICLGFFDNGTSVGRACVNEDPLVDCWGFATNSVANVNEVQFTSNDGEIGTDIGVGATNASLLLTSYSYSGSC